MSWKFGSDADGSFCLVAKDLRRSRIAFGLGFGQMQDEIFVIVMGVLYS